MRVLSELRPTGSNREAERLRGLECIGEHEARPTPGGGVREGHCQGGGRDDEGAHQVQTDAKPSEQQIEQLDRKYKLVTNSILY